MIKKDCFALNLRTNRCKVLLDTYCKKENCKFYKTQEQFDLEAKKAKKVNKGRKR